MFATSRPVLFAFFNNVFIRSLTFTQPTMLMDFIAFVEPLMSFVDFMGAQKTATSSFIVPRLITAKVEMERKANELATVPGREYVAGWYNAFYGDVWQTYLDCFLHDKFLLASTLLDIRIGYKVLTNEVLTEAIGALRELVAQNAPIVAAPSPDPTREHASSILASFATVSASLPATLSSYATPLSVDHPPSQEVEQWLKLYATKSGDGAPPECLDDPSLMFSAACNGTQNFPILLSLHKDLSLILPSEAAAERVFKNAKFADTPQRTHTP